VAPRRSRRLGIRGRVESAAVTVIQRLNSAVDLSVHFHALVLDSGCAQTTNPFMKISCDTRRDARSRKMGPRFDAKAFRKYRIGAVMSISRSHRCASALPAFPVPGLRAFAKASGQPASQRWRDPFGHGQRPPAVRRRCSLLRRGGRVREASWRSPRTVAPTRCSQRGGPPPGSVGVDGPLNQSLHRRGEGREGNGSFEPGDSEPR